MIVKRNLGDIAELTAGVISQRVLADKEDVETGDSVFVLVPKAIHDGELDEEWSECLGSCFSPDNLLYNIQENKNDLILSNEVRTLVYYPRTLKHTKCEIYPYAFLEDSEYIETLVLPETLSVCPDISKMRNLKEILVSDYNPYFTSIDGVLFNKDCTILLKYPPKKSNTTYRVPDSVLYVEEDAFKCCSHIEEITYCSIIDDSISKIKELEKTKCIVLGDNPLYLEIDGVFFSKDKKKLVKYPNTKKDSCYTIPEEVEEIDSYAFKQCDCLTDIVVPKKVTEIKPKSFYFCKQLCNVVFLSEDTVTIHPEGFLANNNVYVFSAASANVRLL